MSNIIFSGKVTDKIGNQFSYERLREVFMRARDIHTKLVSSNKKIAYFFIDPLLNSFEGANQFYFAVFECERIDKINTYKSGASPVQALADAKELIECGLCDAAFIFGYEPLLTNRLKYGKEEITKAMSIFENQSIIKCYNEMARLLCVELGISKDQFGEIADQLYMNYLRTFEREDNSVVLKDRGRRLVDHGADLFKLTDCANPNIDFAGGVILANDSTANLFQIAKNERVKVSGVKYSMVEGAPEKIGGIVGKQGNLFPHLRHAFLQAQNQSKINVVEQLRNKNLYLDVYTCYPPVPIGFLMATGMIDSIDQLPDLLERHEITVSGGMNLARAPWNNPALNGVIDMYHKLKEGTVSYGLIHGNGGIGEIQGVVILEVI
ncbi:hypothetical protein H1D32_16565 [Anaerobacillus sp. CMMVII]|uniref:hypothetical protein n=1 Tax=Anaerobacillus sp. CMMVII TaxID=2755588 RepID=UPI0021B6F843|nr:hypothetical protein [Anaerobacillus sp. CMMVII]MCT8139176.1 hypothetical protein [Anaerobacillus sp. CMMVII]